MGAILGYMYYKKNKEKREQYRAMAYQQAFAAQSAKANATAASAAMTGNAEDQEVDSSTKQALNEQEEYRKRLRGIRSTYAGSTAMNSGGTSGATTGSASTLG